MQPRIINPHNEAEMNVKNNDELIRNGDRSDTEISGEKR